MEEKEGIRTGSFGMDTRRAESDEVGQEQILESWDY